MSHKFCQVKDNSITSAKGLLYKGEDGMYFAAEKISKVSKNRLLADDLSFFRGIEGHENIVRCFMYCTFDDQSFMKLTEVGDGNLKEFISEQDILPLKRLYFRCQQKIAAKLHFKCNSKDFPLSLDLLHQAALGLKYLHDNRIIHRNIQPSNVLLIRTSQNKTVAKLGGFRYCKKLNHGCPSLEQTDSPSPDDKTALLYMASECHKGLWSKESDVFAFGIMTYYTLTKQHSHPFQAEQGTIDIKKTVKNIQEKQKALVDFQKLESEVEEEKHTQKAMIQQMVDHNPAKRLKIDDVLYHPTFYPPQRKLDFLLTVHESLEKFYHQSTTHHALKDKIDKEIDDEEFLPNKMFQNYKHLTTSPLYKKKQKQKKNQGGWKPIEFGSGINVKLLLRTLRNNVVHACDCRTPAQVKEYFGAKDDYYDPAKLLKIFVTDYNPRLLIALYDAYKKNEYKYAVKFYPKT